MKTRWTIGLALTTLVVAVPGWAANPQPGGIPSPRASMPAYPTPPVPHGSPAYPTPPGARAVPAATPLPLPRAAGFRTPPPVPSPGFRTPPPVPRAPSPGLTPMPIPPVLPPAATPYPGVPMLPPTAAPTLPPLKPGPVANSVRILSQTLAYDRKTSLAVLTGQVKIFQEDTVIEAEKVRHDSKGKITHIEVPFKLVQTKPDEPKTTLTGQAMVFYHREKRVNVNGDVHLIRHAEPEARPASAARKDKLKTALKHEDTNIRSRQMTYWTEKKDADFLGTVVAYQKEKKAEGDHAWVDNARKKIYMEGSVVLTQIKGDWLVREGLVDESEPDADREAAIKGATICHGDQLEVDQVTNDAVVTGALVRIDQKDRHATGRRAVFRDKDQTMTLTENVRIMRDGGDWMTADKAVFHTDNDRFEAYGGKGVQVETEFMLEESPAPKKK